MVVFFLQCVAIGRFSNELGNVYISRQLCDASKLRGKVYDTSSH